MTAIPWANVARGIRRADEFDLEPHLLAGIDQSASGVRDRFAWLALPLDRPHNVYAALAVCDVLHEAILVALRGQQITPAEATGAFAVLKGLEFCLAAAAPDDARTDPTTEGKPPMNHRLDEIDKITTELHARRRRRNPEHGAIKAPDAETADRFAIPGECVGCREDATYVVDELGSILRGAGS